MNGQRDRLGTAAGQDLATAIGRIDSGIEKLSADFRSAQALLLNQMAQRLLHFGVENVGELRSVVAVGRGLDESFHRGEQSAVAGEPDRFVRPQPAIIKAGHLGQGIEAAPMSVTGEVAKLLEFAEDGEIGVRTQHASEFG